MTKEEILDYFKDINFMYNNSSMFDTLKRMLDELTEPCENCVSRTDILQKYEKYCEDNCPYSEKQRDVMCGACFMGDAIEIVEESPSIQPEKAKGKWIKQKIGYGCSKCTLCTNDYGVGIYKFCPNCGADMRGGD